MDFNKLNEEYTNYDVFKKFLKEDNIKKCIKLFNKSKYVKNKLTIGIILSALNNNVNLINCSKHLIMNGHLINLHDTFDDKAKIPVNINNSHLLFIKKFYLLYSKEDTDNLNLYSILNLLCFISNSLNTRISNINLYRKKIDYLKKKIEKIIHLLNEIDIFFLNMNKKIELSKLIKELKNIKSKLNVIIKYYHFNDNIEDVKVINEKMKNNITELKSNYGNIIELFNDVKKNFDDEFENNIVSNIIPYIKYTILLYIINKYDNKLLTKNTIKKNILKTKNEIKIQTRRLYENMSYEKFQKIIISEGSKEIEEINISKKLNKKKKYRLKNNEKLNIIIGKRKENVFFYTMYWNNRK